MTVSLVADAADSTTSVTGLGLVEDAQLIAAGIRDGSWIDGTLGGLGAALDGLTLAVDPLGTLAAWGVAWLIEHVRPLQDALDWLAGNPDEVAAHAATWANIAAITATAHQDFTSRLDMEVAGWAGTSADAYRTHAGEHLTVLQGISTAAGGISFAVEGTGLLVGLVRGIVRDLIAQFIATLAVRIPQWLAMEGLTLGVATPLVVSQVSAMAARWANEIQRFVRALLTSLRRLLPDADRLNEILDGLRVIAERLGRSNPADRGEPSGGAGDGAGAPTGKEPTGRQAKPEPADVSPEAFVNNIAGNPRSLVGRPAQWIADQFNAAGYSAIVEQSSKTGTSGNAIQVRVQGHPEITNIQVHPGGGRHTPAGSPYWKISTSTVGKTWVIPKDFRGADGLGGSVVRYDE